MDTILNGMDGIKWFVDDVLIAAKTREEHMQKLEEVLKQFKKLSVLARKEECIFLSSSVEYLGYCLDAEGQLPYQKSLQPLLKHHHLTMSRKYNLFWVC